MNKSSVSISIEGGKKGRAITGVPFLLIKNKILGKKYELSVAFVSASTSLKLNKEKRGKNKPTNVLSFALSKDSGELIFHADTMRKEAKNFHMTIKEFAIYLAIHGMLHLKGFEHSSTMEKTEKRIAKIFGVQV